MSTPTSGAQTPSDQAPSNQNPGGNHDANPVDGAQYAGQAEVNGVPASDGESQNGQNSQFGGGNVTFGEEANPYAAQPGQNAGGQNTNDQYNYPTQAVTPSGEDGEFDSSAPPVPQPGQNAGAQNAGAQNQYGQNPAAQNQFGQNQGVQNQGVQDQGGQNQYGAQQMGQNQYPGNPGANTTPPGSGMNMPNFGGQQGARSTEHNKIALYSILCAVGAVLGLIIPLIFGWLIPYFGALFSLWGMRLGNAARHHVKEGTATNGGMAMAGFIVNIILLVVSALGVVFVLATR